MAKANLRGARKPAKKGTLLRLLKMLFSKNDLSKIITLLNISKKIEKLVITDSKGRVIKDASLKKKIECFLSHERFKNVEVDYKNYSFVDF